MPPVDNRRQIQRVLMGALSVNILVMILKLILGIMSGSLAVLADAMHSATDAFSSLMGLFANRLSDPRPDRDHPYGHRKYEAIGSLGIAAFIFFTAFEILQASVQRILERVQPLRMEGRDLLLLLLVLVLNVLLASYERRQGRRLGSSLLIADSYHTSSDVWTTVVVLIGLAGAVWLRLPWLDVALAVPLSLLLFKVCWRVLRKNLPLLVDEVAIPAETIHAAVMEVPGVLNCHAIASRGALGQQVFIDLHLVADAVDLEGAHRVTERVEHHLVDRFGPLRCTIQLEPRHHAREGITYPVSHG